MTFHNYIYVMLKTYKQHNIQHYLNTMTTNITTNITVNSMISNCYSLYSQEVQNLNEIPLIKDAPPTTRTIINQTLRVITK